MKVSTPYPAHDLNQNMSSQLIVALVLSALQVQKTLAMLFFAALVVRRVNVFLCLFVAYFTLRVGYLNSGDVFYIGPMC